MRVLLTGATGFVGRHVLRELAERHEVVAIAREPVRDRSASWVALDLTRPLERSSLPASVDAVVHLAQSERYRDFPNGAADVFGVTVRATFELLDYAHWAGARRFVLASTGGVYGSTESATESQPVAPAEGGPLAHYLNSKLAAEALVRGFASVMEVTVLRPFFVYGPGQRGMLMRVLAERILNRQSVTVEGRPGMHVNPIYVADVARAVRATLEPGVSGTFNVAGDEIVSISELVRAIASAAGEHARIEYRDGEVADLVADTTRMRQELRISPDVKLAAGLSQLVQWLRR